jgi:hypothetical protein
VHQVRGRAAGAYWNDGSYREIIPWINASRRLRRLRSLASTLLSRGERPHQAKAHATSLGHVIPRARRGPMVAALYRRAALPLARLSTAPHDSLRLRKALSAFSSNLHGLAVLYLSMPVAAEPRRTLPRVPTGADGCRSLSSPAPTREAIREAIRERQRRTQGLYAVSALAADPRASPWLLPYYSLLLYGGSR